jgi:hypothetical protein
VRWHRAGFRRYWRWKSRPQGGRPQIDTELRVLIRRMSVENPLWGAPRIHGELLKLGFEIAQSSVAKYMVKRRGPPSQGWRTFLRNHAPDIAAMDLLVVPTIGFDLLYAFVIVRLGRRDLVWINVTANPTTEWGSDARSWLSTARHSAGALRHGVGQVADQHCCDHTTFPRLLADVARGEHVVGVLDQLSDPRFEAASSDRSNQQSVGSQRSANVIFDIDQFALQKLAVSQKRAHLLHLDVLYMDSAEPAQPPPPLASFLSVLLRMADSDTRMWPSSRPYRHC